MMWKRLVLATISGVSLVALRRWWQQRRPASPSPDPQALIRQLALPAALERQGASQVIVRWQLPANTAADTTVRVHLGDSWQTLTHRATVEVEGEQAVIIDDVAPQTRLYAEIHFESGACVRTAERVLPLDGTPNFRDIGGYPTREGRTVRWDTVYRASSLANLSQRDIRELQRRGVHLVCDLRTTDELAAEPNHLPRAMRYLHFPAESSDSRAEQLLRLMFDANFLSGLLLDMYTRVMIDENPQVAGGVLRQLADPSQLPAVVHCAAGKDRTGIVIALLLVWLGVPDDIVIADYTLSNHAVDYFKQAAEKMLGQLSLLGVREADIAPLLVADGAIMEQTLAHIRETYGSVEAYLRDAAGLDDATLAALRDNLLQ